MVKIKMAIEFSGASCARPFGLADAIAIAPARCGIARPRVESVVDIATDDRAMEAEQDSRMYGLRANGHAKHAQRGPHRMCGITVGVVNCGI